MPRRGKITVRNGGAQTVSTVHKRRDKRQAHGAHHNGYLARLVDRMDRDKSVTGCGNMLSEAHA